MSTVEPAEPTASLDIPLTAFNATLWVFVAVSGIMLACRLVARVRGSRRLFWDDGLVIFAWVLSLATAAIWQRAAEDMYYVFSVASETNSAEFVRRARNWLNASLAAQIFFYTILGSIKLSFLLFFHRLGRHVPHFNYVWWAVLVITVGSYLGSIGNINYKCFVGTVEQIDVVCATESEVYFSTVTIVVNAALVILTDLMIMLLPAILLWNTRIRWSKKLALMGLFSLSAVTIVAAIVRAAVVNASKGPNGGRDASLWWFLSAVESSVAIMVCCGSAFPQLFTSSSKKPEYSPSETVLRMRSRLRHFGKRQRTDGDASLLELTKLSQNGSPELDGNPRSEMEVNTHRHEADVESGHAFCTSDQAKEGWVPNPSASGTTPAR
ncbi:hypothetical protein PG995_007387 [Apiospora arundinis]